MSHPSEDGLPGRLPMSSAKRAVPWVLLGVILLWVSSIYGQFRQSSIAWDKLGKSRPSLIAANAAVSDKAKKRAAEKKAAASKQVECLTDLTFRKGPGTDNDEIGTLSKGEKLTYRGKSGSWYKVSDSQGRQGWVYAGEEYTRIVPK